MRAVCIEYISEVFEQENLAVGFEQYVVGVSMDIGVGCGISLVARTMQDP